MKGNIIFVESLKGNNTSASEHAGIGKPVLITRKFLS